MNYYPFHIGDYAAHTQRLSLMEDLAYRRMIDAYYLDERPFSGRSTDVARAIGMMDHLEAVEYVLDKFFVSTENGFQNSRCDEEIARYHDKQAKASSAGKASAERRLKQKATDVEITPTDVQLTKNQEPRTNNQKKTRNTATAVAAPDGVVESVWSDFCQHRKAKGAKLTQTALDGIEREANKAAISLEDALREICARGWTGFKAEWVADRQRAAPSARQPPDVPTFAERDRIAGMQRWEVDCNRKHPDLPDQYSKFPAGTVIDIDSKALRIAK